MTGFQLVCWCFCFRLREPLASHYDLRFGDLLCLSDVLPVFRLVARKIDATFFQVFWWQKVAARWDQMGGGMGSSADADE